MAVGSVTGALLAASRGCPSTRSLVIWAGSLGALLALGALMPNAWSFGLAMAGVGVSAQAFTAMANSAIQLNTSPTMRGRVMAIFMAVAMGGTPLGAPLIGWVSDIYGPRFGLGLAGLASVTAAAIGASWIRRNRPS
jgi:hypothetical protein